MFLRNLTIVFLLFLRGAISNKFGKPWKKLPYEEQNFKCRCILKFAIFCLIAMFANNN